MQTGALFALSRIILSPGLFLSLLTEQDYHHRSNKWFSAYSLFIAPRQQGCPGISEFDHGEPSPESASTPTRHFMGSFPADTREGKDLSTDLQRELWAVSAQNWLEVISKLEAGLRNDIVRLFKYVTDWQKTMKDLAKKRRQTQKWSR
ncbi:uncharacterized protein EAF01_009427 [Botrytis porri]|uniref:uncharacterized protein n=1 Tax=Botrytis porri TaxID=87229 RepID=UPI001900329F|nr:uncharacterized protein EAF01_009427 [Botrytis porri]KAF7895465.1 hypothetical protein EAF01_009427 [Botrytis porri]